MLLSGARRSPANWAVLILSIVSCLCSSEAFRRLWEYNDSLLSDNVPMQCSHAGFSLCCALLSDDTTSKYYPRRDDNTHVHTHLNCRAVSTVYIPSSLETQHIETAKRLVAMQDETERSSQLVDFLAKDLPQAQKWLARVHFHSQDTRTATERLHAPVHEDDLALMSRFNTTLRCGERTLHWIEWIEPLTVHARNPLGFLSCPNISEAFSQVQTKRVVDPGHILVSSYQGYVHRELLRHKRSTHLTSRSVFKHEPRRFLLDAGTSTFNTNLAWFSCAYLQREMDFDKILAWEYTPIDPELYFSLVPPRMSPFVNFQNVPIAQGMKNTTSVLRVIKQIAQEQDFVAFKLDIDTPQVEIPIMLELLRNDDVARLVDEFFFELHFQCEVMNTCGWGKDNPPEVMGFKNDRYHTMRAFQEFRQKGMRAHFWP